MYMRIKFTKSVGGYSAGDTKDINGTEAQHYINVGAAEMAKDMTASDYKSKGVKSGNASKLRPNKRR